MRGALARSLGRYMEIKGPCQGGKLDLADVPRFSPNTGKTER